MSRIGKEPVKVPAGATVAVQGGVVAVKGPKGELKYTLPPGIECKVEDGAARFTRGSDDRRTRAFHGLARALVANMVEGVVKGYSRASASSSTRRARTRSPSPSATPSPSSTRSPPAWTSRSATPACTST